MACVAFLHCYHHGATILLCFSQLRGRTPVSWVPVTLNLAAHTVTYWYYFRSTCGVRVWWKKYITRLQIGQFIIDLAVIFFAFYNFCANRFAPRLPHYGPCQGDLASACWGICIIASYLVLYLGFYRTTYRKVQL